jgi:ComF family protein
MHRLKYRRDLGLGDALAAPLAEYAARLDWQAALILPVPLGDKRYRERGYNQVDLVAWPLAMRLGWYYAPHALARSRETISQVGLSAQERKRNVHDAFWADPRLVRGRSVVVMDDVATTGATLSACAQALLGAGAEKVYALTIARALPRHGLKIV